MAETLREVTELRLTAPDSHGRKGWKMKNKKNNLQNGGKSSHCLSHFYKRQALVRNIFQYQYDILLRRKKIKISSSIYFTLLITKPEKNPHYSSKEINYDESD